MERWQISILTVALVLSGLLLLAPDVVLVVFAGLLLAVFLHGGGGFIVARLGLATGWGIGVLGLLLVLGFAAFGLFAAAGIAAQFESLVGQIPAGVDALRSRLDDYSWGAALIERADPSALFERSRGAATAAVATTFGALANLVVILFIGIYVALDPAPYRRGLASLFAPSVRPGAETMIDASAATLRRWLAAQLAAIAVVGLLTGIGLWIIGLPLAPILGLIAALLAFIPNIGPIIAFVPALLIALPDGPTMALSVAAVYLGAQTLESYVVTPLLQQESVSLPPAFIIAVQVLFGVTFGLLGLTLATPLAAVGLMLTRELYVDDYLNEEQTGGERWKEGLPRPPPSQP